MNKAALYRKANQIIRCDTQQLMHEFASVFEWRSDGRDSVLDAGCGPGDVFDIILSHLPPNFERLVGIDISKNMIDHARKTQLHPKLSFELFNLDIKLEKQSLNGIEPFDHIVSFFCLMWIRNQKTCLQNFYKLFKPGGDMLLVFINYHVVYDVYKEQSQDIRWAEYTNDYDQIISPYYCSENPQEEFSVLLRDCGFSEYKVRVDEKKFSFDDNEMRDLFHSVNPFIDRIPVEKKQAYLDDLMHRLAQKKSSDFHKDSRPDCSNLPYTIMVAYARK